MSVPVLVVDDDPLFLDKVRAVFADPTSPFAIHTVQKGIDAVAFLEARPPFTAAPRPAFVVLDFLLHDDMNAPGVLRHLASRDGLRDIPVLILSQANWDQDMALARAAGAAEFRLKPSRARALRDIIMDFWKERVDGRNHPADRR